MSLMCRPFGAMDLWHAALPYIRYSSAVEKRSSTSAPGKPESAFGDDAALHLAGAAVDGGHRGVAVQVLDPTVDRRVGLAVCECPFGAEHVDELGGVGGHRLRVPELVHRP